MENMNNAANSTITIGQIDINASNIKEYAYILDEIIKEYAVETGEYIPSIIKDVARYYGVRRIDLVKALKTVNSEYTANNNIVFYYKGQTTRRTAYTCAQRTSLMKLGNKLADTYTGIEDGYDMFMEHVRTILTYGQLSDNLMET